MTKNYLVSYVLSLPNALPQFKSGVVSSYSVKEAYDKYGDFSEYILLKEMGVFDDYIYNCTIIAISAIPNKEG